MSVVAATRNRAGRLEALLRSLREQTLDPGRFEVVVVDDGSSDETPAVLEAERERGVLRLRAIHRERAEGPASARNAGWRAARAPLIAFIDDDCEATPGWLEAGLRALNDGNGCFVQGRTDPNPGELHLLGPFSRTLQVTSLGPWFQTCNVWYPVELLERLGGFDAETFTVPGGEDADLAWRAIRSGAEPVFVPEAQVYHAVNRLGPAGKLRVAWRWSETMRLFARYPELRERVLVHGLFWKGSHYLLARALVARLLPRRWVLLRAWLARPYMLHLIDRGRIEGGGLLLAPYYALHDVVELGAAIRGALRYRTPVL